MCVASSSGSFADWLAQLQRWFANVNGKCGKTWHFAVTSLSCALFLQCVIAGRVGLTLCFCNLPRAHCCFCEMASGVAMAEQGRLGGLKPTRSIGSSHQVRLSAQCEDFLC